MNRDEIVTRTGAESWNMVVDWFNGKTQTEIQADLDDIFPFEDENEMLAEAIYDQLKYN
jgi:hypothetical protein